MVAFLQRHAADGRRAPLVAPRRPLPSFAIDAGDVPADAAALNAAVVAADHEGKGMPVLLRHYLKLGARALSFSVDPAFGDSTDALMVVDLQRVPEATLKRFDGASRHAGAGRTSKPA